MQELDWAQVGTHLIQLGAAFVLALPCNAMPIPTPSGQ